MWNFACFTNSSKSVPQIFFETLSLNAIQPDPRSKTARDFYLSTRSCDAMRHVSCARKQKWLRTYLPLVYRHFLSYFIDPTLKHIFENSLKLPLRMSKWFNAFQILKLLSFFLSVTCVIFARATNIPYITDFWQAIVACAIMSRENCWTLTVILTAFHAA